MLRSKLGANYYFVALLDLNLLNGFEESAVSQCERKLAQSLFSNILCASERVKQRTKMTSKLWKFHSKRSESCKPSKKWAQVLQLLFVIHTREKLILVFLEKDYRRITRFKRLIFLIL